MSRPSNEWIDSLADDLKHQGREAAEAYGRDQHRAGIVAAQSPAFFTSLTLSLEEDFAAVRARLQGSAVASETAVERAAPAALRLTRARFPWFEATLKHEADTLLFEFAKSAGTAPDPALVPDRRTIHFVFQVDAQDRLFVAESFADSPRRFDEPADVARHLVEILFTL